jgi:hypothetical protein
MRTCTTLDGRVLDLSCLTEDERAYFDCCVAAYRRDMPWEDFSELAEGSGNPLVKAANGWVTKAVWEHPLFQATSDLADRLGIAQGELGPVSEAVPASHAAVETKVES